MIQTRKDMLEYIEADRKAQKITKEPHFDPVWNWQKLLRRTEYHTNAGHKVIGKLMRLRFHLASVRLGFNIPLNTCGKGLNIHHYGLIAINRDARIGENCCINQGVNIGQNMDDLDVPTIGNNVYIGPGAKLFGKITIADGVAIGANAVVTKSILEENVNVVGVPAKIIEPRRKWD